ncbi:MAG: GntR family transcriptional regulator, partial [Chitinivibrionales bacterium]|nr:GntR family transcriptional regulator [Chitinivibrionales bacterium]
MGTRPAVGAACRWLRKHIEQERRNGARRLAAAVVLARQADVSHVTMLEALRRLHNEGVVVLHRGRPTRIAGAGPGLGTEESGSPRVCASRRIARRIRAD